MNELKKPDPDNPLFLPPVSKEEFEEEFHKFDDEDMNQNDSCWTLHARWGDLVSECCHAHDNISMEIMGHASGEHTLYGCLARALQLGLEIGYRLGSK